MVRRSIFAAAAISLVTATHAQPVFRADSHDVLPALLKSIAAEIRSTYVAGYYPSTTGASGRHQTQVVLASRDRGQITGARAPSCTDCVTTLQLTL